LRNQLGETPSIRRATLERPEHRLTESVRAETDVLALWGHAAHDSVHLSCAA
jgi:trehalose utilization protein